jgi:hypothetical protein
MKIALAAFALAGPVGHHHAGALVALLACGLVGMAFTHSVGVLYKSQEGTITNTTDSYIGNAEEGLDVSVPAATTDQAEAISVTVANIVSLCLFSPLALTVKTYAGATLKDTIALAANKQIVWTNTSPYANPFANNFDTIKLTNADPTKAAAFKARFLLSD